MEKRIMAWLLVTVLCFAMAAPSFASMATASDWGPDTEDDWIGDDGELVATSSDASLDARIDDLMDFADVPMLMSFGDDDVNQYYVPYADVYKDGKWLATVRGSRDTLYDTANQVYYYWPKRDDGAVYVNVLYRIPKAALPSSGTYGVEWSFRQGAIGLDWVDGGISLWAYKSGVAESHVYVPVSYTTDDVTYCRGNVEIGYNTSLVTLSSSISPVSNLDVCVSRSNAFMFTFSKHSDQNTAVSPDVSAGQTAQDAIADSSGQIANNTASMADTLKEIVQTISNQLAALWDQMYNLMHVPQLANDDKNTQRIIDKLGDDLNVEIQNDNDNTETIINGYDRSEMDSANGQLGDSFQAQADQEQQIMDQISEPLEDFSFESPVAQYLSTFRLFGDFLQQLFVNSGAFKDVINLAFIMTIALMCAGLYRFKGGN